MAPMVLALALLATGEAPPAGSRAECAVAAAVISPGEVVLGELGGPFHATAEYWLRGRNAERLSPAARAAVPRVYRGDAPTGVVDCSAALSAAGAQLTQGEEAPRRLRLSRVRFSRDGAWAAIELNHACPGLCGYGQVRLLHRLRGRWAEVGRLGTWVS